MKKLLYIACLAIAICSCNESKRETKETILSTAEYGRLMNPVRMNKAEVKQQIAGTWELRGMILENRTKQWWIGGEPNGTATFYDDGTYKAASIDGKDEESGRWLLDNFKDGDVIQFRGKKQLVTFKADTMYMRELSEGFFVLYVKSKD